MKKGTFVKNFNPQNKSNSPPFDFPVKQKCSECGVEISSMEKLSTGFKCYKCYIKECGGDGKGYKI